ILMAQAGEGWNTAPAGISQDNGNVTVRFPAGLAIPVREEGYLFINATGWGKSAGDSAYYWEVIVYYIKKSVR
ncbi:unnamed protein product, partial [marine sediment metagenome]